jgi:hypothetical protein
MASIPVKATNDRELARAQALARVLDSAVGIPGTRIRVGLDALLGLIPGAGDIAGAVLSGYIVLHAARRGASRAVLWRMIANVAIDAAIGTIPILGDLFDVGYKSNMKNVQLFERYAAAPEVVDTRSKRVGAALIFVLLLLMIGVVTLGFLFARFLWRLLTG